MMSGGSPGTTDIRQQPGTRDPGSSWADAFFRSLGNLPDYPRQYPGQLDPGLSPTMQNAIRMAQGYASTGPPEILAGVQGVLGRLMSPQFQNPMVRVPMGHPDYFGQLSNRVFGGQPANTLGAAPPVPATGDPKMATTGQGGVPTGPTGPPAGSLEQMLMAAMQQGMNFGAPDTQVPGAGAPPPAAPPAAAKAASPDGAPVDYTSYAPGRHTPPAAAPPPVDSTVQPTTAPPPATKPAGEGTTTTPAASSYGGYTTAQLQNNARLLRLLGPHALQRWLAANPGASAPAGGPARRPRPQQTAGAGAPPGMSKPIVPPAPPTGTMKGY